MPGPSTSVIVGTDGSSHSEQAVAWAADEATLRKRPLRIVHVLADLAKDMPTYPARGMNEALPKVGRRILAQAEQRAHERQPELEVSTELLREGMPYALREQSKVAFELVLGHRGLGGFRSLLLGSTGLRVAGHAAGPVVIVRGQILPTHNEVVVGVDPFKDTTPALDYAFEAAAARNATLRVIQAFQLPETLIAVSRTIDPGKVAQIARESLTDTLAPWRKRHPQIKVIEQVIQDHPVNAMVTASGHADLLVVSSHGHSALGGAILGSTSHGVLHHAHCPIAIVRPATDQ